MIRVDANADTSITNQVGYIKGDEDGFTYYLKCLVCGIVGDKDSLSIKQGLCHKK